jgi:hypothetical protein
MAVGNGHSLRDSKRYYVGWKDSDLRDFRKTQNERAKIYWIFSLSSG